ncbi:hypothetical protein ANCCEY_10296 [Ancylostoma ceylanicum]|uniref:Uncharacterized protein n=1 Tax=Ancylostoma ceylanicum TaxID=53326 RepID=A0A0D6LKV5_9BILA|nr:hypothetical protein ANCCEY_10296 [Ancylostoma ceylanicum]
MLGALLFRTWYPARWYHAGRSNGGRGRLVVQHVFLRDAEWCVCR